MAKTRAGNPASIPAEKPDDASRSTDIITYHKGAFSNEHDVLTVERSLEIHIAGADPLITMRTPGHDEELAAGLLYGEGVVQKRSDIVYLRHSHGEPDVIRVMLRPEARDRLARVERNTLMNSACGVCGKPSFKPPQADIGREGRPATPRIRADWLLKLPAKLRREQNQFESTGGLHAAALFSAGGELRALREDVGRHNALDKLVGRMFLDDLLPLKTAVIMLSGRASYELLQKAVRAQVPIVCAISAPSSFAVALAEQFSMTLVGFIRGDRFNIYAGAKRIEGSSDGEE